MKFILFNLNDENKNKINRLELDNNHYINELSLSKTKLEKRIEKNPKMIQKIKNSIFDKDVQKKIYKALDSYDKKWYYILSKNITDTKYITIKAQELLGYKLNGTNELDTNIFKYIDEYLEKADSLKKHEVKVLLVTNTNKNLNFTLISNLIKEYKCVNIYLNEIPSAYTIKRIKQINKLEGTTIEIVKKERKQFLEYNVIYFVDDKHENYPRFRFNKNALVIDVSLSEKDKFNSSILFMDEYINNKDVVRDNMKYFLEQYSKFEFAGAIRKIIN